MITTELRIPKRSQIPGKNRNSVIFNINDNESICKTKGRKKFRPKQRIYEKMSQQRLRRESQALEIQQVTKWLIRNRVTKDYVDNNMFHGLNQIHSNGAFLMALRRFA